MKFVQLTEDLWVNPENIARVEQREGHAVIYFTSGRERALVNTDATTVVQTIEEAA